MEPLPDLKTLLDAVEQAEKVLAEALPHVDDPELKKTLMLLTQDFATGKAELVQVYPDEKAALEARYAALAQSLPDREREAAHWEATLAAMEKQEAAAQKAAATAKPQPAPRKAPPTTVRPPVSATPENDSSVWRDDSASTWESNTQGVELPAPQPARPTAKPKPAFDADESVRGFEE
jgi:hypothetical protein